MSVFSEHFTQMPGSSPLRESSSSEFCASSGGHEKETGEASSRLAARLERSEYKRSRGKRLHKHKSSSSLLGKARSSDDSPKRKSSAPAHLYSIDAENRPEECVKSLWEVQKEEPLFLTGQSQTLLWTDIQGSTQPSHSSHCHKTHPTPPQSPIRPQSWYGTPQLRSSTFPESRVRPLSMHEIPPERRSFGLSGHDGGSIPKRPNAYTAEPYKSRSLPHYSTSNDLSKNVTKSDHLMSRSLSSSVSSYVGSMEDRDGEHHGVYSAYDVSSCSPYSVLVHRRYSQSSLSSSSTSWNQSSPSLGYQTPKTSRESIHQSGHQGRVLESPDYYERKSFAELSPVSEGGTQLHHSHWNAEPRHDSKQQEHSFSSSYNICLSKKPASSVSPPNVTQSETRSNVSQSYESKPHRLNVTQAAEMSVSQNYSRICETYDGETHRATVKQVATEASVIQRQNHASFDPTYDSESRKVLVTHANTEPNSNQSRSHPNVYQRHNRESHNVSLTQAVSVTARSYQTVHKDKTEHGVDTSPSVKDLAKRFSGCHDDEVHGDMRKVKAETWPKVVHVQDASFYDNDVDEYTLHPEKTSSDDFYHIHSESGDIADNMQRGITNNYQRTLSRDSYENERDFKSDHLRGDFVKIEIEMMEPKSLLDSERNNKTDSLKRTDSRDCETERPVMMTRQRLDFKEPDDTESLNVVYRRKNSRDVNGIENGPAPRVPPRPKSFPAVSVSEPVALRSEASHSTQGSVKSLDTDGISHRLSLQELIRLHEERIAIHARSAMALSHVQIYLKRPVSDLVPYGNSEERYNARGPGSKDQQRGVEFARVCESDISTSKRSDDSSKSGEWRSSTSQYEIKEVQSADGTPIKVIELRDKGAMSPVGSKTRERSARVKRHRTIGIVGVRQQIDRATENTPQETKPKRHTAIGIVSVKALPTSAQPSRRPVEEEVVVETRPANVVQSSVEGALEDLADLAKSSRNDDRAEAELRDRVEGEKVEETVDVTSVSVSKRDERQKSDQETKKIFPPSGVSQDPQYQQQASFFASVTQSNPSNAVTQSNNHNAVTQSTQNNASQADMYEDSLGNESPLFGSTKPRPATEPVASTTKPLPPSRQTTNSRPDEASNTYIFPKPYLSAKIIPVAQVSPVSPISPSQQAIFPLSENHMRSSPLSSSSSAREMYETRLALLNLVPSNMNHTTNAQRERRVSEDNRAFYGQQRRNEPFATALNSGEHRVDPRTDALYLQLIEQLRRENQELREKFDGEKREWKQKYEEQKKVANAYQKLEDRYRRRVHELQDALGNCSCQSFLVAKDSSILGGTPVTGEKINEAAKANNNSGLRIIDELEEWLTEQSRNTKANNVSTSHDSLISSSSDLTGMGWDDSYDMVPGGPGQIDHVNGTHV